MNIHVPGTLYLPEAFRGFPILRELEMPLNGLRSIHPKIEDYANLEVNSGPSCSKHR